MAGNVGKDKKKPRLSRAMVRFSRENACFPDKDGHNANSCFAYS